MTIKGHALKLRGYEEWPINLFVKIFHPPTHTHTHMKSFGHDLLRKRELFKYPLYCVNTLQNKRAELQENPNIN